MYIHCVDNMTKQSATYIHHSWMLIIILYTFLVVKRNSAVLFIICEIFVIIVGKINCVEMTSVAAWVVELCMEKINVRHCNKHDRIKHA